MELLEKYFEIAINTPNGITRLRELILKLAIRGNLTIQDKNELSGDKLLDVIQLEKKSLFKQGKIKKQIYFDNKNNPISPFIIPNNWIWTSLNNIVSLLGDGIHGTPQYDNHGEYYFINGNNLTDGRIEIKSNTKTITEKEFQKHKRDLTENTVLVSINGTLGNVAFYDNEKVILGKSACYFNLMNGINKHYIKYIIKSNYFIDYAFSSATGSTIKNVSLKSMRELPIPLPPQEEQNRIVKKIEELMCLCDQLEKHRNSKLDLLSKINNSAINKLITAEGESSLNEAWEFIQNKFELVFADKKNVFDLKEVILNLAMRGKLATSDSNDTPASNLLIVIAEERKLLEKQKLISKQKELPQIAKNDKKYDLPLGWEWVRLNEFGSWKSGSTPSRTNQSFYGGEIPWVKSGEVKQGRIKETSETITELALQKCSVHRNPIGSVLIAMYGANIGEVGILEIEAATNQAVCACKTFSQINNEFLYYLLQSLKSNFISQGAGAAQPNISRTKIINTVVPLPPINEQKRIVKKIENLFQLADLLESNIEESSKKQIQILNSVLANI